MHQRRYVLLDRDGTIIALRDYLSDPEAVELIDGAAAAMRQLASLGLGLVLVTNQSGLGRGYFDEARLEQIHRRLTERLAAQGAHLDAIYYCPHLPDHGCRCRKPRPGMVEQAAADHGFDPRACFLVGDSSSDIELGKNIGAKTLLVRTGYGAQAEADPNVQPDHVVDDFAHAAQVIACLAEQSR